MGTESTLHRFLIAEYGAQEGNAIHELQQKSLKDILANTTAKSESQMKTLRGTILPRVALYKVLEKTKGKGQALYVLRKYMLEVVGARQGKRYAALERIPGFFWVFRRIMIGFIKRSDNWTSCVTADGRREVRYNITKCLWLDACLENGCPELCPVFCDTDEVIYGRMKKVVFSRCDTLAKGGEACDFCFTRAN